MIFVSTGGFPNKKGIEVYNYLQNQGISHIEFSGGLNDIKFTKKMKNLKKNFQFHNYFPPPKKSFVLNLSSTNANVATKSMKFVEKNIIYSKIIGCKFYSFHAGYLTDPLPSELGFKIKKKKIISKEVALELFKKRLFQLLRVAKKNKIKLLIENNVLSKKNLNEFGINPFLLTEPKEIEDFFKSFKNYKENLGLLLDTGHLKVSSKTLGFNLQDAHKRIKAYVKGYHLSDNNGKRDNNKEFTSTSWFWKNMNFNANFYTIEVYNCSINKYKKLVKIVKKKIY